MFKADFPYFLGIVFPSAKVESNSVILLHVDSYIQAVFLSEGLVLPSTMVSTSPGPGNKGDF